MIAFERSGLSFPRIYSLWFLLAAQAGYVNVGGFVACEGFVSHVTGYATNLGMSFAQGELILFLECFAVFTSFVLGGIFVTFWTVGQSLRGQKPRFDVINFMNIVLFALVFFSGISGFFGDFHDRAVTETGFILIPVLAFTCGAQNAACAITTNGFLKPTHLTGLSTDFAIAVSKIWSLPRASEERANESHKNQLRVGIFVSYIAGATAAMWLFPTFQYYAFLAPLLSAFTFWTLSLGRTLQ